MLDSAEWVGARPAAVYLHFALPPQDSAEALMAAVDLELLLFVPQLSTLESATLFGHSRVYLELRSTQKLAEVHSELAEPPIVEEIVVELLSATA